MNVVYIPDNPNPANSNSAIFYLLQVGYEGMVAFEMCLCVVARPSLGCCLPSPALPHAYWSGSPCVTSQPAGAPLGLMACAS